MIGAGSWPGCARSAAAWAGLTGIAQSDDGAVRRRLRGAACWLGEVGGVLPATRAADCRRDKISRAGDHGTTWRSSFGDFTRLLPVQRRVQPVLVCTRRLGDRPLPLAARAVGPDFLVRVGWNSMRMVTADGARLDLASMAWLSDASPAATKAKVANRDGSRRG